MDFRFGSRWIGEVEWRIGRTGWTPGFFDNQVRGVRLAFIISPDSTKLRAFAYALDGWTVDPVAGHLGEVFR
jgi:hypothetical protein